MRENRNRGISRIGMMVIIVVVLIASVSIGAGLGYLFPGIKTTMDSITTPPFCGKDTIRILILGEDNTGRTKDKPYGLSDTIMLASIDFKNNRVAAVSIPRDTRVEIPGYGTCKINAAHAYGGPALAQMVVEQLTGIRPDYFIKTNLDGFKDTVDLVGGVEIYVEKNMNYDDNWGHLHIHLKKGLQTLDGENAMGYVRFRHDKLGDITRMERQQKFIKALAKKMTAPENLPKLPWTIKSAMKNITTNMNSKDILHLAKFAGKLDMDQVKMERLPGTPEYIGGVSYWVTDQEKVYEMIAEMFSNADAGLPKVEVLNGSGLAGAAQKAAEALRQSGFVVTSIGNADSFNYASSQVISHKPQLSGLDDISQILNISILREEPSPASQADVTVIIGKDYML